MASVRITAELIRSVERRINTRFHSQTTAIKDTLAKDFGDRVYAYSLRKELKHIDMLPKEFFVQIDRVNTKLKHFEDPSLEIDIALTTPRCIPYNMYANYSTRLTCDNSQLYDEYRIMNDKLRILNIEQSSVRNAIVTGIESCTTLKKFLSIMPEAEMFIPQSSLDTHYQSAIKKPTTPKVSSKPAGLTQEQRVTLAKAKMSGI